MDAGLFFFFIVALCLRRRCAKCALIGRAQSRTHRARKDKACVGCQPDSDTIDVASMNDVLFLLLPTNSMGCARVGQNSFFLFPPPLGKMGSGASVGCMSLSFRVFPFSLRVCVGRRLFLLSRSVVTLSFFFPIIKERPLANAIQRACDATAL
nr:hypothetical protein [Pandoravirus massiliensis]